MTETYCPENLGEQSAPADAESGVRRIELVEQQKATEMKDACTAVDRFEMSCIKEGVGAPFLVSGMTSV
jgi:hypothetical protein